MKRFSIIFLCITLVLLLLWQLPWCYTFFAAKPSRTPFSMYSCVIGDFLSMGYEESVGLIRRDQSGNNYTQEQTDSILPLFYVKYKSRTLTSVFLLRISTPLPFPSTLYWKVCQEE